MSEEKQPAVEPPPAAPPAAPPSAVEPPPRAAPIALASLLLVLAAVAGIVALFARQRSAQAEQSQVLQRELAAGPLVRVAHVKKGAAERTISLPAEVRAERRATLYAKVSGYVKEVRVDRGDRVTRGQALAVLESPDLDEQVASAQAELSLRKLQAARAEKLSSGGRVSQSEREQASEAVQLASSALARARVMQGYQVLRAPFDGTVTARFADAGALLPAATGSTSSAQPLLEVAQIDRLRVALQLGQDEAARVHQGDKVMLRASPDEPAFEARISRLAQTLDPRTRTMLCEIDLVRPPAGLYPGAFVQASVGLRGAVRAQVPTEALVAQAGKLFIALVQNGKIHFQPVRLGVDDGQSVEVLEGLQGDELVALSLSSEVAEGATIRTQEPGAAAGREGAAVPAR